MNDTWSASKRQKIDIGALKSLYTDANMNCNDYKCGIASRWDRQGGIGVSREGL